MADGNSNTQSSSGRRHPDARFRPLEDIVLAKFLSAASDATGEAFNNGTGTTITIANLGETTWDGTDAKSDSIHVDPQEGDIDHSKADITKAREQFAYEPQYSIESGLEAYLG